jgi:8-oxo-dGTP diphosphatase
MVLKDRGKVWLAAAGLVINERGKWLVVKKKYGGLKGKWSLPAGFIEEGETADQGVVREVFEETGISCVVLGLIGMRTGVIRNEVSDNMVIFQLKPIQKEELIQIQHDELLQVAWMSEEELLNDIDVSVMIPSLIKEQQKQLLAPHEGIDPGNIFGYTSYKLFF